MASPLFNLDKPTFDQDKVTVVFVLGGPGAGAFSGALELIAPHDSADKQARARNVLTLSRSLASSTSRRETCSELSRTARDRSMAT